MSNPAAGDPLEALIAEWLSRWLSHWDATDILESDRSFTTTPSELRELLHSVQQQTKTESDAQWTAVIAEGIRRSKPTEEDKT